MKQEIYRYYLATSFAKYYCKTIVKEKGKQQCQPLVHIEMIEKLFLQTDIFSEKCMLTRLKINT